MSNAPTDPKDLRKHIHEKAIEAHLDRIQQEMRRGFELLQKYPRSVTVFGSSLSQPGSEIYEKATELGRRIVTDLKYTVISGGGPGIMEAVSKGAAEAGGTAVGLRIELMRERTANPYVTDGMDFSYFFTRKTMLAFAAECYVFFPGGYGTFDELFSILTLMQTFKVPRVPLLLYDSKFWTPLVEFIRKTELNAYHTIEAMDMDLFEITDSLDRIIEVTRKASVSDWWKNIN